MKQCRLFWSQRLQGAVVSWNQQTRIGTLMDPLQALYSFSSRLEEASPAVSLQHVGGHLQRPDVMLGARCTFATVERLDGVVVARDIMWSEEWAEMQHGGSDDPSSTFSGGVPSSSSSFAAPPVALRHSQVRHRPSADLQRTIHGQADPEWAFVLTDESSLFSPSIGPHPRYDTRFLVSSRDLAMLGPGGGGATDGDGDMDGEGATMRGGGGGGLVHAAALSSFGINHPLRIAERFVEGYSPLMDLERDPNFEQWRTKQPQPRPDEKIVAEKIVGDG